MTAPRSSLRDTKPPREEGLSSREEELLLRLPELLLAWYDRCARVLPWRSDPTPYRVWISEIMLQQTRVEAVKPYYARFLEALPDVSALAQCPPDELMKLWEGLGYYSRARNLQKAAQAVVRDCGGALPCSYEALRSLPGIGEYTAGAIASIAFGLKYPAVDGNVLRVVSRVTGSRRDISDPGEKERMSRALKAILPDRVGDFNQSLMELGACVCLPNGEPLCGECPLGSVCAAKALGLQGELPVKAPKKARRTEERTVFLIRAKLGDSRAVALRRRPESGLLAGMWEFPSLPGKLGEEEARALLLENGFAVKRLSPLPASKHIFTHVEWRMTGWEAELTSPEAPPPRDCSAPLGELVWISPEEMGKSCALPTAFRAYRKLV